MLISLVLPGGAEACGTQHAADWPGLFEIVAADTSRIQPALTERLSRLDRRWPALVAKYRSQLAKSNRPERVVAQFVNSIHDSHRRAMQINGRAGLEEQPVLRMPFRVRAVVDGHGLPTFRVVGSTTPEVPVGARLISMHGQTLGDFRERAFDAVNADSPEGVLDGLARLLELRSECRLADPVACWRRAQPVTVGLLHAGRRRTVEVIPQEGSWPAADDVPFGDPWLVERDFRIIGGDVGVEDPGFLATFRDGGRSILLLKLYAFRTTSLYDRFFALATSGHYAGAVIDFSENVGGDLTAYRFIALLLGNGMHLDLSATPIIADYACPNVLSDVALFRANEKHLSAMVVEKADWAVQPFVCESERCAARRFAELDGILGSAPKRGAASQIPTVLISGARAGSMTDIVIGLYAAHRAGPIVGVEPRRSSARFAFEKSYTVAGDPRQEIQVRYTPTLSLMPDCTILQADPLSLAQRVPRTSSNYRRYVITLWQVATQTLPTKPALLTTPTCDPADAHVRLRSLSPRTDPNNGLY